MTDTTGKQASKATTAETRSGKSAQCSERMGRLGIFGGTFDPIHIGHLRTAIELRESLSLERVAMLPCHQPSHRGQPGASSPQRIAMLKLATAGTDQLMVDTREADRDEPSYSVDTLSSYRKEFPHSQLLFCMGVDAFNGFTGWHRWQSILDLAHLVVVQRPGSRITDESQQLLAERQCRELADLTAESGNILVQSLAQIDISATRIRELAGSNRDINYLVPESVRRYIEQNGLYQ